MTRGRIAILITVLTLAGPAAAGVGDPQVRTDHPWYPGELACSTFERLFATEADVYRRVTGRECTTDEDKALAAWLWRNTHYWHGEEGVEDLWGKGFGRGGDPRTREYWTGLFAHGFGLCGTTHSQWVAEMEARLGHGRGRETGASGHNSFEVFLTGGPYGAGRWALLDHDLSTVVFDPAGERLLGLREIAADWRRLTDRSFKPGRQRGWLICGLHAADNASYAKYDAADYLSGYAGPPPMVHLRRGETLRRYLEPGLEDGKTFVFWGRDYNSDRIPGPERPQTWVNHPNDLYRSKTGAGYQVGRARFANAVYTYRPDFPSGDYREGVIAEDERQVTFEFVSPYIIAATPVNAGPWGVYEPGCRNGLVVRGTGDVAVSVSVDHGQTWTKGGKLFENPDLTDAVKGHRQYWLRLDAGAGKLFGSGLTITTVCQASAAVMPRLKDGGTTVQFAASGRALSSVGPTLPLAKAHVVAGKFDSPTVTLEAKTPHGEPVAAIYAAAHVRSSAPPDPKVHYQIEFSTDGGKSWRPIVKDWTINRQGDEPADFWSQSFCWGNVTVRQDQSVSAVRVRFRNDGGKSYARAEVHLAYPVKPDATRVTFAWSDDNGGSTASRLFTGAADEKPWTILTGRNTRTNWVEFAPAWRR
jgi:hypothetical protein